jgi:acyl-CoA hydrolase
MTTFLHSVEECVDHTIATVGKDLVVAAPLGLGKPVQLLNAFYRRAAADPSLSLRIITALCLEVPHPKDSIEKKLAEPIMQRLFRDYEELAFMAPLRAGALPANIHVSEFYVRAGSMVGNATAQQNYISSNYTHIARDMDIHGVNVLVQLVAKRETGSGMELSLSCNPDVTLELFDLLRERDVRGSVVTLAQVHADLPFMEHDAQVSVEEFDCVVDNRDYDRALFAVPNGSVPLRDYAAALHASSLIVDGGTLQVGIGALGDAVAHACIIRQKDNSHYRQMLSAITSHQAVDTDLGEFEQGLYVSTEMFVNGMLHLIEQGIVKRRVYDNLQLQRALNAGVFEELLDQRFVDWALQAGFIPQRLDEDSLDALKFWGVLPADTGLDADSVVVGGTQFANDFSSDEARATLATLVCGRQLQNGRYMHGGFFLGPRDFYQRLHDLDVAQRSAICMTGVRRTNQLLLDYPLYCAQRREARFINTGMKVSLSGAVASDGLENGTVISGVGGQYNFVAMAQDLPGARSILCIRSTRGSGDDLESNIVPAYGHCTIPRHLRDIVVTEYGIADLRGQSDAEIIKRLIAIADSRFQQSLVDHACKVGKLEKGYSVPVYARNNTPEHLQAALAPFVAQGSFPEYPFGTELTEQEMALAASLRHVKSLADEPTRMAREFIRALLHREDEAAAHPWLERIDLEHPDTPREYVIQQLLLLDLEDRGLLKVR